MEYSGVSTARGRRSSKRVVSGSKGERVFAFRELPEMCVCMYVCMYLVGRWWDRQVCSRGRSNSRDCCMSHTFKVDAAEIHFSQNKH
jgi:hypothetical protein